MATVYGWSACVKMCKCSRQILKLAMSINYRTQILCRVSLAVSWHFICWCFRIWSRSPTGSWWLEPVSSCQLNSTTPKELISPCFCRLIYFF